MTRSIGLFAISALFALGHPATAQHAPEAAARAAGDGLLAGLSRRVHFDERPTGELWALADTYKAGFDASGATFVPFFGSLAPRNFPVSFRVRGVRSEAGELAFEPHVLPARSGERIVFERGPFAEVYDLGLESVEQSFHFADRPCAGSLSIELEIECELARGVDASGLVLEGEFGRVHYSAAIAIDARGTRVPAPTRWREGRVEIELPAAELDRLHFPLVVDPVISVFSITPPTVLDGHSPDVVYDEPTGWWCVAFERTFSASDHDIFSLRLDADGQVLWDSPIDVSPVSWTGPKIANNRVASQILVVASAGPAGGRRIQGRTQSAFLPSTSGVILISPAGFDAIAPDVGGDASLDPATYYCVVWQRVNSANDHDIRGQMVATDATLHGPELQIAGPIGTLETYPAISHNNGDAPASVRSWTIAWHRFALLDSDLYGARVSWNGSLLGAAFPIETTVNNTRYPSVSSPTRDADRLVMIAFMRGSSGNTDTWAYVLRGATTEGAANITALTGAPPDENHVFPSVDCDGSAFVIVETQSIPNSASYALYASTVDWIDDHVVVSEGHVSLGVSGAPAPLPEIACAGAAGGPPRSTCFVWHYEGFGPNPTLFGGLYEAGPFTSFCEPGMGDTSDCPCGNAPGSAGRGCDNSAQTGGARLVPAGGVAPDSLSLTASGMLPNAISLLVQASVPQTSSTFGDGLRCAGGNFVRMGVQVAPGGQASWPGPGQASISALSAMAGDPIQPGSERFYFVYYRDPNASWGCVATFNSTQAVQVLW